MITFYMQMSNIGFASRSVRLDRKLRDVQIPKLTGRKVISGLGHFRSLKCLPQLSSGEVRADT